MPPSFSTRSSRITSMCLPSLLHEIGQQAQMTGALDRLGEFALFLRAHRGDARGNDLAALGDEALKQADVLVIDPGCILRGEGAARSEEHTSELQSLMRISYAVFCLKKKTSICTSHNNLLYYT